MRVWHGMSSKTSSVDSTVGISEVQENTRLRTDGELQRRWGMIASGAPKQDGPILLIASAIRGNFLTFDLGGPAAGEIEGLSPLPDPLIDGPKWRRPEVLVGNPVAPVVNFVTYDPTSPPATYIIGVVSFTANVTYDGLSGPLSFSWSTPTTGVMNPTPLISNANPASFDFDATCFPGNYAYTLTVQTGNGAFTVPHNDSYTVL